MKAETGFTQEQLLAALTNINNHYGYGYIVCVEALDAGRGQAIVRGYRMRDRAYRFSIVDLTVRFRGHTKRIRPEGRERSYTPRPKPDWSAMPNRVEYFYNRKWRVASFTDAGAAYRFWLALKLPRGRKATLYQNGKITGDA
jgi:hypothetical protein